MANDLSIRRYSVVPTNPSDPNHTEMGRIALYNADGTQASTVKRAAAQPDTVAADLAALKVDFNALLAKLRTAGIIAP